MSNFQKVQKQLLIPMRTVELAHQNQVIFLLKFTLCSSSSHLLKTDGQVTNAWCAIQFSSVQSLSRVWLFATLWIAARQASLSITNSQSSLKLIVLHNKKIYLVFFPIPGTELLKFVDFPKRWKPFKKKKIVFCCINEIILGPAPRWHGESIWIRGLELSAPTNSFLIGMGMGLEIKSIANWPMI